jgi:glyoxylase-like metal-dependent hydrolase (beta-lactamase superfamily II)
MGEASDWMWRPENAVIQIGEGLWRLDLGFQGREGVIAAYLMQGFDEIALYEVGPASTVENLRIVLQRMGFEIGDLTHALVSHIHLDHAGALGVLCRENPALRARAHPFGVPHLVDPSKLVASATRIYQDQMEPLWGEVAPVPEGQLASFDDGETLEIAGRALRIVFTPGHAWHHVVAFDVESKSLFTGDVGGVRMPGMTYVCPPTPPPDLDFDAWSGSIETMRALEPSRLCLTHFGVFDDVDAHLAQIEPNLEVFANIAEATLSEGGAQETLAARLHEEMAVRLPDGAIEELASYEMATPSYMAAMGLMRDLKKRTERDGQA